MRWLFSTCVDRIRALFLADAAMELESQALAREAERKAELLRQAEDYRAQGLGDLADELQQRTAQMNWNQPLAGVLPAVAHWRDQGNGVERPAPLDPPASGNRARNALGSPSKQARKKR